MLVRRVYISHSHFTRLLISNYSGGHIVTILDYIQILSVLCLTLSLLIVADVKILKKNSKFVLQNP